MTTRPLRVAATVAMSVTGALLAQSPIYAATPATHACVGSSISAAATGNPAFGRFVSGVAHDPTSGSRIGVGDDLQALQAGQVPDSGFVNNCNG